MAIIGSNFRHLKTKKAPLVWDAFFAGFDLYAIHGICRANDYAIALTYFGRFGHGLQTGKSQSDQPLRQDDPEQGGSFPVQAPRRRNVA